MMQQIAAWLIVSAVVLVPATQAQQTPPQPLELVVNADLGRVTISRHIYGQFAEHLGRGIYDGVWTTSGTSSRSRRESSSTPGSSLRLACPISVMDWKPWQRMVPRPIWWPVIPEHLVQVSLALKVQPE